MARAADTDRDRDRERDRERRRETGRDRRPESERLNTPGRRRRSLLPRWRPDADAFGKFAEGFARFMGTATFLAWMSAFIVFWLVLNLVLPASRSLDPYPFIFLTLLLSLQASYAAPLILLAQNRQEARDRVALDADRQQTAQSRADMDFLAREIASLRMSVGDLATRDFLRSELRTELRALLAELAAEDDEALPERSERADRRDRKPKKDRATAQS